MFEYKGCSLAADVLVEFVLRKKGNIDWDTTQGKLYYISAEFVVQL
jgi:hypothetical protein